MQQSSTVAITAIAQGLVKYSTLDLAGVMLRRGRGARDLLYTHTHLASHWAFNLQVQPFVASDVNASPSESQSTHTDTIKAERITTQVECTTKRTAQRRRGASD